MTNLRAGDLLVEYRDRQLVRRGAIPTPDLRLKVQPVLNGVGSWSVQLPTEHRAVGYLRAQGAGVIITNVATGAILMSGSASKPTKRSTASDPKGMTTISGLSDDRLLWDALSFPQPSNPDTTTQTESHDVFSSDAETVLRHFVDVNIGQAAPAARKTGSLREFIRLQAVNGHLGAVVEKSVRFSKIGDVLREIATLRDLRFRIVQVGSILEFQVSAITDRTDTIRLDVENGTLQEQSVEFAPPTVTRPVIAGQGEGTERQIIQRTNATATAAEVAWGLIIEEFKDQRNTNVTTELEQAGDEMLAEGGYTKVAVKATPSNDQTMVFLEDFDLGDKVTVVIDGQETTSNITEAAIIADDSGTTSAVAIGDIRDFDSDSALRQTVTDNVRRIAELEKNAESGTGELPLDRIPDIPSSKVTGNFALNRVSFGLAGSADLDTLTTQGLYECASGTNGTLANHYPIAGSAGILEVYVNGGHLFQRFTFRGDSASPTNANRVWVRGKFSTNAWSAWRELSSRLPGLQQAGTGSTYSITAGSWSAVPGFPTLSLVLEQAAWVTVTFGAWMTAAAGDTRASVQASGATVIGPIDLSASDTSAPWGQTLYKAAGGTGTEQHSLTRNWLLNAGTTVITAMAYQSGGGAHAVNYPVLEALPVRWAD